MLHTNPAPATTSICSRHCAAGAALGRKGQHLMGPGKPRSQHAVRRSGLQGHLPEKLLQRRPEPGAMLVGGMLAGPKGR